ncbi:N-acetyltransferase [Nocardiopsis gilva YIM 90087]|uniref:N-acetyltransferase n=1 Tax=Nocardiopsis gilva YIM 90087 TaxID=1235441 RepID=A0A223S3R8_9ACTN|nr:GNAT family N-acetyltransferase [Nocardiopsis gilva]ASU82765.1 N-acetyltransferase [Nocardiopsis gilva YIM 90087]
MIRPARPEDIPTIHRLVRDLAEYEKEPDAAVAAEEDFAHALFGPDAAVFAHIAEHTDADGSVTVAGFALWFRNFSTWTGKHGIYLEDLYVRPEMRGHGYGKALLAELAAICVDRGYTRLEWSVLDWNTPSIDFYKSLGAVPMDEWTVYRLADDSLTALGTR